MLRSTVSYARETASWRVDSTVSGLRSADARRRVAQTSGVSDADLVDDENDVALHNLVAALPLALDQPPPVQAATGATPAGASVDGGGGAVGAIVVLVVLLLLAMALVGVGVRLLRGGREAPRPAPGGAGPRAGWTTPRR